MKKILTLLLVLMAMSGYAQHNPEMVHFHKEAKERSASLHADYPKVAQVKFEGFNSIEEQHQAVDKAWHDLWANFTAYYHEKGLFFDKKHRVYVHLHFKANGHLDYFGYRFKGKETDKEVQFVKLFKEYIATHDFDVKAGVKFSQCGELHLLPRIGVKEGL